MRQWKRYIGLCLVTLLALSWSAHGEIPWQEGKWRLELSGFSGVHSGSTDRSGDLLITTSVDYELPVATHATLSLRLMPLWVYEQHVDDEKQWRFARRGSWSHETVIGMGFGLAARWYSVAEEYRGWFGEIQANALGHDAKIDGNSANLNFLTGIGAGYKFKNNWHAILKYEHISNAGLGAHNRGANGIGIGVGYTF